MTIEISKEVRQQAISSIERYFLENMDEKIGNITAGALLSFFVKSMNIRFNIGANTIKQKRSSGVL